MEIKDLQDRIQQLEFKVSLLIKYITAVQEHKDATRKYDEIVGKR